MNKWLINIGIALAVFTALQFWQTRDLPTGVAPDTTVTNLFSNQAKSLPDGSEKIELLYFFAPWCQVCQVSINNIAVAARGFSEVIPRYVAFDFESKEEVQSFIQRYAKEPDVKEVYLGDSAAKLAWSVSAYPTYVILGGDGKIKHVSVGYSTTAGIWLRLWLAQLGSPK